MEVVSYTNEELGLVGVGKEQGKFAMDTSVGTACTDVLINRDSHPRIVVGCTTEGSSITRQSWAIERCIQFENHTAWKKFCILKRL